jgi:peptidyl-prolyl cis-trans isomerase C
MKKLIGISVVAGVLFAFPGMNGMGMRGGLAGKPLSNLKDSTVLATVNGKKITVKDINIYLQGITGDKRIRLQDLPAQHVKQFVNQYIETIELYPEAKKVENSPEFQVLKKKIAIDFWLKQKLDSIKVSDKEAKEFYEKYKDIYFKTTPKIKARHILVKDKETAEKIINELKGLKGKALEEKFASLAKKYSVGPTKVNGGELGWFDPKQMVGPFAEAVEKMKPGEITLKPVKTRFGWHVILVEDKQNNSYIPFDKVKPQIIAYLKRIKLQKELQKIKSRYNVTYSIPKK